jgi:hypothetical protein
MMMDKIEKEITARWKKEKAELNLKRINELDKLDKKFIELLVKYKENIKGKPELEKYIQTPSWAELAEAHQHENPLCG